MGLVDYKHLYFYYQSGKERITLIPEENRSYHNLTIRDLSGIILTNEVIPQGRLETNPTNFPALIQEFHCDLRPFANSLRKQTAV